MTREAAAKASGPNTQQVTVLDVDLTTNKILVRNAIGAQMNLDANTKPIPQVGELWLLDRTHGKWMFSQCTRSVPPTVTGSRAAADPVTLSLLAALVQLGHVADGTSP